MVLGLSLPVFTAVHVAISLIAILAGVIVVVGMLSSLSLHLLTPVFLITTALTSITGFFFPFHGVTPGFILGVISLLVLLPAFLARYAFAMRGSWRWIYAVCSILAVYMNVFVLIAQLFQKVPALRELAPTGTEPPFLIAQAASLVAFLTLGIFAVRRFHPVRIVLV